MDFTVVTLNYAPGKKITKNFGSTFGIVVRSRGLGGNIIAGLRSLFGGEIKEYSESMKIILKTLKSFSPSSCVFFQTLSLLTVHGVLIPIQWFLFSLLRFDPLQ